MRVAVTNVLRVQSAELELAPGTITAVTGANRVGKTSLASIVGGALAFDGNPLRAGKGAGGVYLRDDTTQGGITVDDDAGQPVVRWSAATGELSHFAGGMKAVSGAAAGLVGFTETMPPKARTVLWEEYFLPSPDRLMDMMRTQLEPHLDGKTLESIMSMIAESEDESTGIAAVAASYSERAKKAKRRWMAITGKNYGVKVAADFLPADWTSELDGKTPKDMATQLEELREDLRNAHVDHALSQGEIQHAKEAAGQLPAARKAAEEAAAALKDATDAYDEAATDGRRIKQELKDARLELATHERQKPTPETSTLRCPCCEELLVLVDGMLAKFDQESFNKRLGHWQTVGKGLNEQISELTTAFNAEVVKVKPFHKDKLAAEEAARAADVEVAALTQTAADADQEPLTPEMAQQVRDIEEKIDRALLHHRLVEQRFNAMDQHRNVVQYSLIAQILGPKGVRATAMEKAMSALDQTLATVARVTAWPRITIEGDYSVAIGGRTLLRVCGDSECLRAQYSLQIAVARCLRDQYVVLDRADTLDEEGRRQLWDVLKALLKRPNAPGFLVCGTDLDLTSLTSEGQRNYRFDDGVLSAL